MNNNLPAVSIVMPIWNSNPVHLESAIASILAQDFENWELLIIEDPSERESTQLVKSFQEPRVDYHLNSGRTSLVQQLNLGIKKSRAEIIARFDGDDICEPNRLTMQIAYLSQHPEIDVVGSQLTIINGVGKVVGTRNYPLNDHEIKKQMPFRNVVAHPAAAMRRKAVLDFGGYKEGFSAAEDYEMWSRMMSGGSNFANLPDRLLKYRIHSGQVKSEKLKLQINSTIHVKETHWHQQQGILGRIRILAEKALLMLPSKLTIAMFKLVYVRKI